MTVIVAKVDNAASLGSVWKDQGDWDAAEAAYQTALALQPDSANAHCGLAFLRLTRGEFDSGWEDYEWRWKISAQRPRRLAQPLWQGESLANKTILLYAEQGLGDTVQFVRYAAVVKARGGTVIVECQRPLLGLLKSCPGIDRLVAAGDALPAFDVQAPLMSLPRILGTVVETIPRSVPYLSAAPSLVEQWQEKLATVLGYRVGIGWQGNPQFLADRQRSIPLVEFGTLADLPQVRCGSSDRKLTATGRECFSNCGRRWPNGCAAPVRNDPETVGASGERFNVPEQLYEGVRYRDEFVSKRPDGQASCLIRRQRVFTRALRAQRPARPVECNVQIGGRGVRTGHLSRLRLAAKR